MGWWRVFHGIGGEEREVKGNGCCCLVKKGEDGRFGPRVSRSEYWVDEGVERFSQS